jgi:hypothetical protein
MQQLMVSASEERFKEPRGGDFTGGSILGENDIAGFRRNLHTQTVAFQLFLTVGTTLSRHEPCGFMPGVPIFFENWHNQFMSTNLVGC